MAHTDCANAFNPDVAVFLKITELPLVTLFGHPVGSPCLVANADIDQ